jgi:hypothetical protein
MHPVVVANEMAMTVTFLIFIEVYAFQVKSILEADPLRF